MLTGGCLCGAVRYQSDGEPSFAMHCCCRDCQRVSGAGHLPILGLPKNLFSFTGETRTYATVGSSKNNVVRHFCPTCGSVMFGMPAVVPDIVSLYVGTLDDPSVFAPRAIVFTSERHEWDRLAAPLKEFEKMPTRG
jgi:hypothetical protein